MPSGSVKWFDTKKGYGYIQLDHTEQEVRVNAADVAASGLAPLLERQKLDFDLQRGYGTTVAVNLRSPFGAAPRVPRK